MDLLANATHSKDGAELLSVVHGIGREAIHLAEHKEWVSIVILTRLRWNLDGGGRIVARHLLGTHLLFQLTPEEVVGVEGPTDHNLEVRNW